MFLLKWKPSQPGISYVVSTDADDRCILIFLAFVKVLNILIVVEYYKKGFVIWVML